MNGETISISSLQLMQRLQFMALFIAVYESFEDYILESPKNFLNGSISINKKASDYKKLCNEVVERQKIEKESAKNFIFSAERKGIVISESDDAYIYANYDYQKITIDGFTKWLSPKYDALITKRLLTINGKKQTKPDVLLNSLMFFNNITGEDLAVFLIIKDKRNSFTHNMAELLITDVANIENLTIFDNLINMYIRVNNYWSVEFECGITDVVPQNADYENIINVNMYNLLSAIDALIGSNYLAGRNYQHYMGLYESLAIPIKEEEHPND